MNKSKVIDINNITAGYDNHKIALKNINLSIYENDFIGIIGPNGGGKTTLLKVILGLLKPFSGEIKYYSDEKEHFIGYLPQFKLIDEKFPIIVKDVILSGLSSKKSIFKAISKEDNNKLEKIMEEIKITDLKNRAIGSLSGGQLQRVFLARAIISNPKILILDEPNTFVDKKFSSTLYDLLRELNKNMTIILVSHDLGTIPQYVKSIACVNQTLHYHPTSEITEDMIDAYACPLEVLAHGPVPHRIILKHGGNKDD
ncbi:metal ABC transporter ATP-binding protein [Haliovirga abyssi]|uniref:Zinc ABC transporter ATP-binding protein n=1 Tax=Haliovirga abyssi TaxID=2996794 RepID=A0AAU9DA60_9FUSO|nr:ATP-binding cassette domain-containing protein [Haliovirga abyssi]BDU51528.1 zinc ABC transporter ATP-binding protein [Haliovirga abyssi]